MKSISALSIISGISLAGILFSGYLTINEMTAASCSIGGCKFILGMPTCFYGLVMYLIVFAISLLGRKN